GAPARRAADPAPPGTPPRRSRPLLHWSRQVELLDRALFDPPGPGSWAAGSPVGRGVQVGKVEDVVAAEGLPGLGERPVGDDALPGPLPLVGPGALEGVQHVAVDHDTRI